jgi:autophagy-related protein 2
MIRIQIRTPSPLPHVRRSGALVFDLHDIVLSTGSGAGGFVPRFEQEETPHELSKLFSVECKKLLIGCSPAGNGRVTAFISLEPLVSTQDLSESAHHVSGLGRGVSARPLRPRLSVNRPKHLAESQLAASSPLALALVAEIPSVNIQISKSLFDDLNFWADDVTQLVERTFSATSQEAEKADSRDTSLIGSRYFARSRRSDSSGSGRNNNQQGEETTVKVAISEGYFNAIHE